MVRILKPAENAGFLLSGDNCLDSPPGEGAIIVGIVGVIAGSKHIFRRNRGFYRNQQ